MEILSRTEVLGYNTKIILDLIIAFIISSAIGMISDNIDYFVYSMIISVFLLFVVEECTKYRTGIYEYEVIINDDVSVKDIFNNYQFVEKRGDIYVIRDKPD